MKRVFLLTLLIVAMWSARPAQAQDAGNDHVTVSFSDPSRPGLLKVSLMNAGITVKAYAGKDVIIDGKSSGRNRTQTARTDGLRRIDNNAGGITVEEENNVMTVSRGFFGSGELEIQVPAKTNLKLNGVNGRGISVEGVEGEIEVTNVNGSVTLTNVAGSVVAHATNGSLVASLREVMPNKQMSFTSM